jgi:hypothetical protein
MLFAATFLWFTGFQQPPFALLTTFMVGIACSAFGIGFIFLKKGLLNRLQVLVIQVNVAFGAFAAMFSYFLVQV